MTIVAGPLVEVQVRENTGLTESHESMPLSVMGLKMLGTPVVLENGDSAVIYLKSYICHASVQFNDYQVMYLLRLKLQQKL